MSEIRYCIHLPLHSPGLILARVCALVDVVHQPGECSGVQSLGHGMSVLLGLGMLERNVSDVAPDVDLPLEEDSL